MWIRALTDVGQKRSTNQDVYVTEQLDSGNLILVCDGMGGEQGGAVASEIASCTAAASIKRSLTGEMSEISIRRMLESAGAAANAAVYEKSQEDASLRGMGTTLIAAVVMGDTAHFIHAGDSRAYLLRDDFLTQLTVDHTVVQMMVERGEISETDAQRHPQRHYITRAVGVAPKVRFDIFSIDLLPEDAILLCSDGLYNYISHEGLCALCSVAMKTRSIEPLIDKANRNGGGDNITAVLCCMSGEECDNG